MGLERLQAGEEGGDSGCAALWRDAYIFHNDYKNSPKNTACTTHCVVHAAGGDGGIRPAALGQGRRQPGELKNHSLDGFFPATGGSFPSHPSFFYAARKRDRKCDLFFVAEKEGFEPSRQSPQPTPLAGEPLTATWVLLHIQFLRFWRRERDSNPRCLSTSLVFKTSSINHSDISPRPAFVL